MSMEGEHLIEWFKNGGSSTQGIPPEFYQNPEFLQNFSSKNLIFTIRPKSQFLAFASPFPPTITKI